MTPEQINLVQTSFRAKIWPISNDAAEMFYHRLFELDPDLRILFSPEMHEQWRKLMELLWLTVNGLDDLEDITPLVEVLGERHVGYGVQSAHYETMRTALLWMLEECIRPDFNEETRAAWDTVYTLLATTMQEAVK